MKRVSFDDFYKEWEAKLDSDWPDDEQFCIYIANPFCRKRCKFCLYKSSIVSQEKYHKYYDLYLPELIRRLSPLISKRIPDTVYFGGGTSSLMDEETMGRIFQAIPNLAQCQYKCFEANPTSMTKGKIDILAEYGFTELSLGVQTFDRSMLEKQGRESRSLQEISELVHYAASRKLFVNIDLLTYYESDAEENIDRLAKDLDTVADIVKPGKITVYPRYETYFAADRAHRIRQIKNVRNCIRSFCEKAQYHINPKLIQTDDEDAILAYSITDYHIYNMQSTINALRNRYNCSGPGYFKKPQNVLGIGGYGAQMPYSYIWNKKQWYMVNLDWNPIVIETSFNDTTRVTESLLKIT